MKDKLKKGDVNMRLAGKNGEVDLMDTESFEQYVERYERMTYIQRQKETIKLNWSIFTCKRMTWRQKFDAIVLGC